VIPAGQQGHVPQITLPDLRETSANWVVEPKNLGSGTLTARTLFSEKQTKSVLPVWNLNDEDFFVRRGTFIGDAISASVCENGLDIGLEERSTETTGSEPAKRAKSRFAGLMATKVAQRASGRLRGLGRVIEKIALNAEHSARKVPVRKVPVRNVPVLRVRKLGPPECDSLLKLLNIYSVYSSLCLQN